MKKSNMILAAGAATDICLSLPHMHIALCSSSSRTTFLVLIIVQYWVFYSWLDENADMMSIKAVSLPYILGPWNLVKWEAVKCTQSFW